MCQGPCSLVQCIEVAIGFVIVIRMMISMTIMIVVTVCKNLGLRENC
jgi:hypothetical protein